MPDSIPVEWLKQKAIECGDPFSIYNMVLYAWFMENREDKKCSTNG